MSFRLEEKIPLTPYEMAVMCDTLRAQGMTELYPTRRIFSTYFDTPHSQSFFDSEEGSLPRKKFRLRHYPDSDHITYAFEIKISSIEGRYKQCHAPTLPEQLTPEQGVLLLKHGYLDTQYGMVFPVANIQYERSYFMLDTVRITCDTGIMYQSYTPPIKSIPTNNQGLTGGTSNWIHEPWCVLEIKAETKVSLEALSMLIPTPRRRFSKFSNAMHQISPSLVACE